MVFWQFPHDRICQNDAHVVVCIGVYCDMWTFYNITVDIWRTHTDAPSLAETVVPFMLVSLDRHKMAISVCRLMPVFPYTKHFALVEENMLIVARCCVPAYGSLRSRPFRNKVCFAMSLMIMW